MKKNQWLHFLSIGQFLMIVMTIFYFMPLDKVGFFIGQYLFVGILFGVLSKRNGFILFMIYNLLTALGPLFIGFIKGWEALQQLEMIMNHLLVAMNLGFLYCSMYFSRTLGEENASLKKKVAELTQYVGASELLTKQEFERRSNLIKKAMERRGESGYWIQLTLTKRKHPTQKAIFNALTDIALATFRSQYDLVGKINEGSFAVLLQNTDEEGMKIAIDRYYALVKEKIVLEENELSIVIKKIGGDHKQGMIA